MKKKIWLVCKVDGARLPISFRTLDFLASHSYRVRLTDVYDVEIEADYRLKDKVVDLLLAYGCTPKIINLWTLDEASERVKHKQI